MLDGSDNDEIEVQISSLGGSVDHAMAIHDRFAQHGNVTAILTGMVASSATILPLGAKKTRMSQNSMYLIHKAMIGLEIFQHLNEDGIDDLIKQLEKDKNELAKSTLVIARMYATKSGKPVKDILNLMKEETWLTAEKAQEWGFIDEIFNPGKIINYAEVRNLVAMIQANGYPVPERQTIDEDSLFNRLQSRLTDFFKPKHISSMKQFLNLNKVLKVEKLESSQDGTYLNEEQLQALDSHLATVTQSQTDLSTAITALNTLGTTVTAAKTIEDKVKAIKDLLAQKPGVKPSGIQSKQDPEMKDDGVDWDTLNSLPHMKELD